MRQWNIFLNNTVEGQKLFKIIWALLAFLIFLLTGCTKKIPPLTLQEIKAPEISFQEYLSWLDSRERIKFLFSINVNKQGEELSGNASLSVDKEDLLLRVYSMGFLVSEIKIYQGNISVEGRKIPESRAYLFIEALKLCLLWWKMDEREIEEKDQRYVIRNSWRKVYLYKNYLPEKQEIYLPEVSSAVVIYEKPALYTFKENKNEGFWFPSEIVVRLQGNEVRLYIEKIVIQN